MRRFVVIALAALGLASFEVRAEGIGFAGVEASRLGNYGYVGHLSPWGGGNLGNGPLWRHWLEGITYRYDADARRIDATVFAYAPAVGYAWSGDKWSSSAYFGVRLAHTRLSPDDHGNRSRGSKTRPFAQADGIVRLAPGIEDYYVVQTELSDNRAYYLRNRLAIYVDQRRYVGPEIIFKGSRDFDGWQLGGLFGGIAVGERANLLLKAGMSGQKGERSAPYGGVELTVEY